MNGALKFGLALAGLPQNEVDDLDRAFPILARLAYAAKEIEPLLLKAEPLIEQMEPHIQALLPLIAELMPIITAAQPIIKQRFPDVVAVTPTVRELIAFAQGGAVTA